MWPAPQKAGVLPFAQQFSKRRRRRRVVRFRPDHDQIDGMNRRQRPKDERQSLSERVDAVGNNSNSGAGLDVTEDRADQAGRVGQTGNETRATTGGENGIMQADALATGKNDERLLGQLAPANGRIFGQRMSGGQGSAQPLAAEDQRVQSQGMMRPDWAGQPNGQAAARDHLPDALRSAFLEHNGDPRITPAKFLYDSPQKNLRRRS